MCGIMGYVGSRKAWPIILSGLKRLEYRGYDSAGIATLHNQSLEIARQVGALHRLEQRFEQGLEGTVGIGHTRWATHGNVTLENCHPHTDLNHTLALVHNGIVDNVEALRASLDVEFETQTDTEVLAALIASLYEGDLLQAVREAMGLVQGTAALVVAHKDHPDELVIARLGSPVVVGLGDDEAFVASDAQALAPLTDRIIVLEDSDIVRLGPGHIQIVDLDNRTRERRVEALNIVPHDLSLGTHPHYFIKETFEQPDVLIRATRGRLDPSLKTSRLDALNDIDYEHTLARICFFGCGTSQLAGDVGRFMVERWAKMMATCEDAAELLSVYPIVDKHTLYVALSQSGETADVLALMRELKLQRANMITLTNVVGNSMARMADANIHIHAGGEFSVAATKSFTAQLLAIMLLVLRWARRRGMPPGEGQKWLTAIEQSGPLVTQMLEHHAVIRQIAQKHCHARYVMFIGRGISLPIAKEGALKLKELSYIPSEGLSAAQMKHGPIALIEPGSPVWVIAPPDHTRSRMLANIQELRARHAHILCIGAHDDTELQALSDVFIAMPDHHAILSPLLSVIPLQLFAYEVALALDRDVDRPRNLAKSVTVE